MTTSTPPALSLIDVRSFYEAHGAVVSGKPTHSREGLEYACSCPACGGTDRASFWESGRFCCVRGCHAHASSAYWFCRDVLGYDHRQACEDLGIDPAELFGDSAGQSGNRLPLFLTRDEPPAEQWQEAAHTFCQLSEKCLWGPKGESARTYLHSRGFTDQTIKQAHLGLCPDWYKEELSVWGLNPAQLGKEDDPQIKIPRGIVIPWYVERSIWKIQLRRPEGGYFEILGSSECLYNVDSFQPGQPACLFESEFDALSAQQEAGDLAACIATGSTTKGRTSRWIGLLKQAGHILQAFDDDEAGESGAAEWLKLLGEKATRWPPFAHDVNDMLKVGDPIRLWIECGLAKQATAEALFLLEDKADVFENLLQQESRHLLHAISPPALLDPNRWAWMPKNDRGFASLCLTCGRNATWWGTQGEPYCQKCCPWADTWPYNQS